MQGHYTLTKHKKHNKINRAEHIAGYVFVSPWLIGFLIFTAFPIISSIILSFTSYDVLNPPKFVGLANYKTAFTSYPLFWKSLYNTFYYVILSVPLHIIIGLSIALLLNMELKGIAVYRTLYYMPSIVPMVANSVLWMWIFMPQVGILSQTLKIFGITAPNWLSDPRWAKISLVMMSLWGAGSGMIIYLAGLKNVPRSYYEAAEIDGAGTITKFFKITLPLITPTIFFQLIMGIIGSFQVFTQAFIMTSGGPVDSTMFYVLVLYNNAFRYFKMGFASALAWVLFFIIMFFTYLNFKLSNRWVFYGE